MVSNITYIVITQPSSAASDPLTINYVSSLLTTYAVQLFGSINGGTALYIHGSGFDPTASNNQVFIGVNPCNISAKGVTADGNTISCDTISPDLNSALTNLPITVNVNGKKPFMCTTSSCLFSYSPNYTPSLLYVYPRSGAAFKYVKFYGVHRISNLGD